MKGLAIPPEKMPNAAYQWLYHASGSFLATIYNKSPAHAMFTPMKESQSLSFGIASHAMLLEPELFKKEFARGFDASIYENVLVTLTDLKAYLKKAGVKTSGSKSELIERIQAIDSTVHIADVLEEEHANSNEGKELIKPEQYDDILAMREAIIKNEKMRNMIESGYPEYSLLCELDGVAVKSRPDLITNGGGIIQYKTTQSCHPAEFPRKANDYGYLLKAALEWRAFEQVYGRPPKFYIFLAQEKTFPYVWKPYYLKADSDALTVGFMQLELALKLCKQSVEKNEWPAYGSEIEEMQLTDFIKRQYGLEN